MASNPQQNTETRELSLIDKVELRIALADSESKLENLLRTYLAPLLLKLASEHLSVRNKIDGKDTQCLIERICASNLQVISVCQHVTTRTRPLNVALPVAALLKQFKENPHVQLIRHFDLLYIQQGFSRLSKSDAAALFPSLVHGVASATAASAIQGATIFNLLLRSLQHFNIPPRGSQEDLTLRKTLEISDADAEFLVQWFGKLILLHLGPSERRAKSCPGMSKEEFSFLTLDGKEDIWNSSSNFGLNLTETKARVGKLLSSGLFHAEEKFIPALFASCEQDSVLSTLGEELLKHTIPHISLEDDSFVPTLFQIYFGSAATTASSSASTLAKIKPPVRMKILSLLLRSERSINETNSILRIVREDFVRQESSSENEAKGNREILKLRIAVINYLTFIGRRASSLQIDTLAPPLIDQLKLFLEHQFDDTRSPEVKSLRGNTYHVIGTLAASHKQILIEPDLKLLRWFFQSLAEESDKDIIVSIDEAISTTIKTFQEGLSPDAEEVMRSLLLDNLSRETQNSRNLRYATVRLANRCLKYSDVVARWIDLNAAAHITTESYETVEEAKKGLDPHWFTLYSYHTYPTSKAEAPQTQFPDFSQLIHFIFKRPHTFDFTMEVLALAISYARQVLLQEALSSYGIKMEIGNDWERKLDLAASEDVEGRKAIRAHLVQMLENETQRDSLLILWGACFKALKSDHIQSRAKTIQVLLELCSLSPDVLISQLSQEAFEMDEYVLGNDIDTRTASAQVFGLLASHPRSDRSRLDKLLNQLLQHITSWKQASGASINKVHGSTLSLAFWISYSHYRSESIEATKQVTQQLLPVMLAMLDGSVDSLLRQGSYTALGQLCIFYATSRQRLEECLEMNKIIEKIATQAQKGDEKAIIVLGQIAMVLDEREDLKELEAIGEALYKIHEHRQPETQFVVGEALACLACGWVSKALAPKLPFDGPPPHSPARHNTLKKVTERILTDCSTTKPSLKKGAVIWLLCLIQFCGDRPEIQNRLHEFQTAFKSCLSDRDELVQESASRGLGLVYERGSREVKDDLVRDLVKSFSSDRANISGTVSEETQLFEEGALPTNDGSIKTYKDIMSLASEFGDSSLVYSFMSLASNNAIWSSRAAFGRFGLSSVFSDSSIDGYLAANPKLYPKLYRYRFDPNPNVRKSMNDIWNALVKDSVATIDQYFDSIIEDLLTSIVGREWRVRQASCAAIADLIQGRRVEKIEPYLERVWTLCFKVLDDIKDSVRVSAAALSRVLINLFIRSLESGSSSVESSNKMLGMVLPFLMSTSGVESKSSEVKAVSITTLLDIVKRAQAKTLRPFLPELIENLIGLLSTLEPEEINYIHLNASKFNMTEQKIDELRLSGIRSSPLMETIDRCIDMLDDDTMKALIPNLQRAMRNAVGMPSKVGCSRVLVSLSTRRTFLFRPYADTILQRVPKYMSDRNETVSGSYAAALGYVARGASDSAILQLLAFAKALYFDSEDARSRIHSGEIVQSIAKHATDRFTALAAEFLPFVFVAKQDESEEAKELFEVIWKDNVGGSRAASMYLSEIVALASQHLSSRRWALKHGAALSIAAAIIAISASKKDIDENDGQLLWLSLTAAMSEKSWDGKERVLEGFVEFVRSGAKFWKARPELRLEIIKITLREARRRNESYRQHAIAALGRVAEIPDLDLCDESLDILKPLIEELAQQGEADAPRKDVDRGREKTSGNNSREESSQEQCRINTLSGAITAVGQSLRLGQGAKTRVLRALDLLLGVGAPSHQPTAVKSALLTSITRVLDTLMSTMPLDEDMAKEGALSSPKQHPDDAPAPPSQLVHLIFPEVPGAGDNVQTQVVRLIFSGASQNAMPEIVEVEGAKAVVTLVRLLTRVCAPVPPMLLHGLPAYLSSQKSAAARATLEEAVKILNSLQLM